MKNIRWWKMAVVVALLLAVVGVIQLKAQQAAKQREHGAAVAIAPVTDEATSPLPAPVAVTKKTDAAVSSASTPAQHPAATTPAKATPDTNKATDPAKPTPHTVASKPAQSSSSTPTAKPRAVPQFIELGSETCVPCKMMKPVMEELRAAYPTTLKVVFIDVWQDEGAKEKYGVQAIPTQVLLDASGKEIFRHVGFWPKDEIVAKFAELGIPL